MRLYIFNLTKQNQLLYFRVPEESGVKVIEIPIGQQRQIYHDRLTANQITNIVETQLGPYGICKWDEVGRARDFTTYCYGVDEPVPIKKVEALLDLNSRVLNERGITIRKQAAIVVKHAVENPVMGRPDLMLPDRDHEVNVEILEQKRPDADVQVMDRMHVAEHGTGGRAPPPPRAPRRRAA